MIELYKAEFRRFAPWALGLSVLHAAMLFLLDRTFPWLRNDGEIAVILAFTFAAIGTTFGFYQGVNYGRNNHWIALLHRPVAPSRIMAAVVGASATVLFLAVLVPLLVFTAVLNLQADRVVDARHWPLAVSGALFALIGLGLGAYLALAPRRYGWAAIIATGMLIVSSNGTGSGALLLLGMLIFVLALLTAGAFKPDRNMPPAGFLVVPTAGLTAIGLYFLLIGFAGILISLGQVLLGADDRRAAPPISGILEASRAQGNDLIAAALSASTKPEALLLLKQLKGATVVRVPVAYRYLPSRHELTHSGIVSFTDDQRNILWTYSHDSNAFEGMHLSQRRSVGQLRPSHGFRAPPVLIGNGDMVAGNSLFSFDKPSGSLQLKARLPAGEVISSKPTKVGPWTAILGEHALYLMNREKMGDTAASGSLIKIPLQGFAGDLQRIDAAPLEDRVIISLFFGYDSQEGPFKAWQRVLAVTRDGAVRFLAERPLQSENTEFLRFRSFWISPFLNALTEAAATPGSSSAWFAPRSQIEVPSSMWIVASILSLLAAFSTTLLASQQRFAMPRVIFLSLCSLLFSIPLAAAFALTFGVRRRAAL